jgi:hypothetical protein
MATGQLGFVYGHFAGTWARAEYPGDPWQPLEDGFLALGSWLTDDRETEYEVSEQVLSWVGGDQLDPGELRFGAMGLIRAAGSTGIGPGELGDFFALLRGARVRPDGGPPDLHAGAAAAAMFGGPSAALAQQASEAPPAPPASPAPAASPRERSPFIGQAPVPQSPFMGESPFIGQSPFAPQPAGPADEAQAAPAAAVDEADGSEDDDDSTGFFELFEADEDDGYDDEDADEGGYEDAYDGSYDQDAADDVDEDAYDDPRYQPAPEPVLEQTAEFDPFADDAGETPAPFAGEAAEPEPGGIGSPAEGPVAGGPNGVPDPSKLWALPDPDDDVEPSDGPAAGLAIVPDLAAQLAAEPEPEPLPVAEPTSYDSLEEAMRAEPERRRRRPEPGPAFKTLHDWCRERTRIVPSGFTIHVYVANPQAVGFSYDLQPPEVPGSRVPADRIGSLLYALWQEETDPDHGAWMFARIDAAGRTLRVDRWYDSIPSWWQGPIADRPIDGADVAWHLDHRSERWQPSYASRLELVPHR